MFLIIYVHFVASTEPYFTGEGYSQADFARNVDVGIMLELTRPESSTVRGFDVRFRAAVEGMAEIKRALIHCASIYASRTCRPASELIDNIDWKYKNNELDR